MRFAINQLIATATLSRPVDLGRHAGSAWRGTFARDIKRLVCVFRRRSCIACSLNQVCLYPTLFGSEEKVDGQTRPFIIDPQVFAGEPKTSVPARLKVVLSVFPSLLPAMGYLRRAFQRAVERGPERYRGCIQDVRMSEEEIVLDLTNRASTNSAAVFNVAFTTPLRLRLKGDLVVPERLTPNILVNATIRRASGLGLNLPNELIVAARAEAAQLHFEDPNLRWSETHRYSSRQRMLMAFGGIIGQARLNLTSSPAVAAILSLATVTHLGKGACMGFGRIALQQSAQNSLQSAGPLSGPI